MKKYGKKVNYNEDNQWRKYMNSVTISPKFQVVIPREIRNSMKLLPGQKIQIIQYENRIELIPERNIADMRGFLKGINTNFEREGDRL